MNKLLIFIPIVIAYCVFVYSLKNWVDTQTNDESDENNHLI